MAPAFTQAVEIKQPFPQVGKTYVITLPRESPNHVNMLQHVTILAPAGDNWFRVRQWFRMPSDPSPHASGGEELWLNFSHVVTAREAETTPKEKAKPEKAP